ncbi:hypothetical protein WJT74_01865 [Sphingomicrobium sp. XHP0239]|uniref:phage fiber-tail adaptor protein n=1 Tax=Sphingomicrobium maritimum TaxID=3133972 RepID=UPI0031CCBD7F
MSLILKDPQAALDYEIDWGADYLDGDTLVESKWSVFPHGEGGVAVSASRFATTVATVTVEGGLPGHVYRLSNQVVTAGGRSDRRSIMLRVEAR